MKELNRRLQSILYITMLLLIQFSAKCIADEVDAQSFVGLGIIQNDNLEDIRAGDFDVTTTVLGIQELQTTLTGGDIRANTIINGDIVFKDNAFSQFSGIGLIVGNTGNNSAINAALGVTIHLE